MLLRQRRMLRHRTEPFLDLVENRNANRCINPLIFVYTIAVPSAVLVAGTALVPPNSALGTVPDYDAPRTLSFLCGSSSVLRAWQRHASSVSIAPSLSWLSFDATWRQCARSAARSSPCRRIAVWASRLIRFSPAEALQGLRVTCGLTAAG
jgi:hypothetical protein